MFRPDDNKRPIRVIDLMHRHADLCPPANDIFDPEELEERINFHRERIENEMLRIAEENETAPREGKFKAKKTLPDWVILCNCSKCKRVIRSPRQPRAFTRSLKDRIQFIMILAGRVDGRPYCPDCLPQSAA